MDLNMESFNFTPVEGINREALFHKYPSLSEIEKKLLSVGGQEVRWDTYEEILLALPQNGSFVDSIDFFVQEMDEQRCFRNCSRIFMEEAGFFSQKGKEEEALFYIGFSLGDSDLWSTHSWIQLGEVPVETTHLRRYYFGYPLPHEKALDFTLSISMPYLLGYPL